MREQRAMKLLDALQGDLRAQMRLEKDELGRNGENKKASVRRKERIARFSDPQERERIWCREQLPSYEGMAIRSLPKTRDFWSEVNVSEWCKTELDAACTLLDLSTEGKKLELIARIQDWVHEPEILARAQEQRLLELQQDAVLASGRVFAFGSNSNGELGLGHRRTCDIPTEIESFRGAHISHVYSGFDANFAFARTDDGQVFAWGGGGRAVFNEPTCRPNVQLQEPAEQSKEAVDRVNSARGGDGGSCFLFPRSVPRLSSKRPMHIACGRTGGHVAMTSSKGECFTWGKGEYGELGTNTCEYGGKGITEFPVHVESLQNSYIALVSVGNTHTAAITDKGRLYTWGSCWSGQLGLGESKRAGVKDKHLQLCFPTPTFVEALQSRRITRVSCGAVHTAVVSADGQLFTFGCGDGGRLGLGSNEDSFHPQLVRALENNVVLDVCCGSWHTLCVAREREEAFPTRAPRRVLGVSATTSADSAGGFVYSFGSGLQGQLGLGKQKLAALPTCIPTLRHRHVRCRAIATSSHHTCALAVDGNLYTWGQNTSGCLGRKSSETASTELAEPAVVDRGNFRGYGVGPIVSIAVGRCFTLFATGPWEPREEPSKTHFQLQTKVNRPISRSVAM
ncbi:putative E3 ubiquitin-protein ligase HERC3 [Phytophthora ramorum]|uniref:putative E3 ubiquitin-protein ligase HERC3 n=1 Tax=Phytophthora ramorum TaxID=164328 RepID=UPI0030B4D084|nr:putative E3 ubiquitin-protein ligase HERC3 [Phytophthora ramorum]